jgi:integrase/recombinase XerD
MTEKGPPRRRMSEDMTVRNLSPTTQRYYVHAVAKFGHLFGRAPERLGLPWPGGGACLPGPPHC